MLKFIKNTTTSIVRITATTPPMRDIYLQPNCTIKSSPDYKGFSILDCGGREHTFVYSEISAYQIDSDPEVSTSGLPLRDFLAALAQDFFFSLNGGGDIAGAFILSGETSINITGTPNHNVVVPDIEKVSIIRIVPAVSALITGFDATNVKPYQRWLVMNEGTVEILTFPENNVNSSPANQFIMVGTSRTLGAGATMTVMYDPSVNKFKIL